ATNGVKGVELWKSDGTADGTVLVRDIVVGSSNSSPSNLTRFDDKTLFFMANGANLWKTDGTADGTVLVKTIIFGSSPANLTKVGGMLFFTVDDGSAAAIFAVGGHGLELWKSDGTTAGTKLVKDIKPGS